ncbi:MAG TPA: STAS domain-containing protein [Rhodanobacteraceae bacterium]|nr:STAS domain-containing protein [Rhodanobacteraceae bacterium]
MFDITCGDAGVVALKGRLDAAECPRAQQFLDTVHDPAMLDFSGLEYISSAGLGLLLALHKRLLAKGGGLRLINVNKYICDVFRFSGFDRVFKVEPAAA